MSNLAGDVDVTPYLPRVASAWAVDAPGQRWRVVDGTLVFADVSGFTALSERLAKRGPIGAEELTDVLGRCFADLLRVAYAEGGSLIKFGGDALLLQFEGDDHATRGVRAALGMRATIRSAGRLATSVGPVRLRMSQGVHTGDIHLFRVGASHKELILAGPAATTTVDMEAAADASEILVSPATAAAIDPGLLGERKAGGILLRHRAVVHLDDAFPPPVDAPHETVAEGLPVALRSYLLAGGGGESEHRHVAIGFVQFTGTDALLEASGPDRVCDAIDEFVCAVQAAADAEDVTFLSSDIYRDGAKAILVAGAPRAGEDADGRLLRAARRIVDQRTQLPVRIGVNRGHVFVGAIGTSYRRAFTIMGDAVNLAARLMAKASSGEIVATPEPVRLSRTAFEVSELPPFHVKGKADPITAYAVGRVEGTQETRVSAHAPLVGRGDELQRLLDAVEEGGRVVDIAGAVGTGKSRLLEEVRDLAGDRIDVRVVTCEQYERTTPYFAFRVLLRRVLGLGSTAGADALSAAVVANAPALERWLPLVGDVAGIDVPDTPVTARLDPRFRRERTVRVAVDLLAAAMPGKTVLAFDDVHWLAGASPDALAHLETVIDLHGWTLVTTRRPDATDATAPDGALLIELGPLEDRDAKALVSAASADAPLPPHVASAVIDRAQGNPLFLEELLRMARRGSGDALPDTLDAVMAAQIDALEPSDRRLVRYAAVLGDSFEPDLFAEVVADDTLRRGDIAARRLHGFVQVTRDGRLSFRHRLVRDVAYQALPFRQRQVLHGRAAQVIERTLASSIDERAAVLSLHCFHAQQFEKCWTYARRAAEHAHRKWAMDATCELYERAIAAARRCPETVSRQELADAWQHLAKARQLVGRYEHADAAYRALRRLSAGDPVALAAVCARHAQVAERLGRATASARWIAKGLRVLDGIDGRRAAFERAHLLTMHATAFYRKGDLRAALRWCEQAIEMARIGRNSHARAEANVLIDSVKTATGAPDMGTYARKALALYERLELRDSAAMVLNNLGAVAYWQGRWDEALALYERARTTFDEMGDVVDAALSVGNVAEIFADQGRLDEADAMLREVVDTWRSLRFPLGLALATRYLARVTLRRGDHDAAIALFDEARSVFASFGQSARVVEVDTWTAECLLHRGETARAEELLADALSREISSDSSEVRAMIHRLRACAAASTGRLDDAWAEVDQSLAVARQRGASYDVALALEVVAALAELGGLGEDAAARRERTAILDGLGVVAPPKLPLTVG